MIDTYYCKDCTEEFYIHEYPNATDDIECPNCYQLDTTCIHSDSENPLGNLEESVS